MSSLPNAREEYRNLPCAVCIMRKDDVLTIEYANERFYELLKLSKDDVNIKYGARGSALFGARQSKRILAHIKGDDSLQLPAMEIHLKKAEDGWYHAEFDTCSLREEGLFVCTFIDITNYKKLEDQLQHDDKRTLQVNEYGNFDAFEYSEATMKASFIYSHHYDIKRLNDVDDCPEALITQQIIHPDFHDAFCNALDRLDEDQPRVFCEVKIRLLNRKYQWVRLSLSRYSHNQVNYVLALIMDIHGEKEAMIKYLRESMFYQALIYDQDAYAQVNVTEDRIEKIGGLWNDFNERKDKESFSAIFTSSISKLVQHEDRFVYEQLIQTDNLLKAYEEGNSHLGCEFRRIIRQNKMCWMSLIIHLFEDPITRNVMALLYTKDIDFLKKGRHEADFDKLTGVYNRYTAEILVDSYIKAMESSEVALYGIIDIDKFHEVNKKYGYKKGDDLLIEMADLLKDAFRDNDIIGRYGGDQFILCLKNVKNKDLIFERIEKMMKAMKTIVEYPVTCSAGFVYINGQETYESSFHKASEVLYVLKEQHPGTFEFYHYDDAEIRNIEAAKQHDFEQFLAKQNLLTTTAVSEYHREIDKLVGDEGDMAYLIDPRNYEFICGNSAFYQRIGLTHDECQGLTCHEILHKRDTPCAFCRKANWNSERYNLYHNYNENLAQDFLIKNKLVTWHGSDMLLALAIDLSNDKEIANMVEQDTSEEHYVLSAIQSMQQAPTIEEMMNGVVESVGCFFRAIMVRFWHKENGGFEDTSYWVAKRAESHSLRLDGSEKISIQNFLLSIQDSRTFVDIESADKMLIQNYDLYSYMIKQGFFNQRWIALRSENGELLGFFEIENIESKFLNRTFMSGLAFYIANEWRSRKIFENMAYQSYHDTLTGLLNRVSYENLVKEYNEDLLDMVAVIAINMNGLGQLNAVHGVSFGDDCLKRLSGYLQEIFHKGQIFRLSGDEFQVVIYHKTAARIEKRIEQLQERIREDGQFSVSVGYAWDDIEKKLNELTSFANQSMRIMKKYHYDQEKKQSNIDVLEMQTQLIRAIENREYEVFLQAKVDSQKNRVVGAEALIRYRNADGEIIPPSKYIVPLEKHNLIRYIDLFVFEEVCRTLEGWSKQGIECPIISLNFSRMTMMEEGLIDNMENIIRKYDVSKKHIQIEITESYADVGKALLYRAATRIHQNGYAVALDDFGTSYTNLSILSDIHVDVLKLDKSLIHSLSSQEKNKIIVKNVVKMCEDLSIEVIAEGVETSEQKEILASLGCYVIQGYLYSKPIEIAQFEEKFLHHEFA